jgi:hypothetical protein
MIPTPTAKCRDEANNSNYVDFHEEILFITTTHDVNIRRDIDLAWCANSENV